MRRFRWVLAAAGVAAGAIALALPGLASRSGGGFTVVADGLNNPRQLSIAPSGAIYVAEAGRAGPQCDKKKENCFGFSGSITRIAGGRKVRVVRRLFSAGGPGGLFAVGADGVSVGPGGVLYIAMATPSCKLPPGLPPRARAQLGRLLVKSGRRPARPLVNIARLECTRNFDRADRYSNPYAVLAVGPSHAVVVDAGANALIEVRGTSARLLAVLPRTARGAQSVPTAITLGPDGAYYVGEFGGEPRRGRPARRAARVWRIEPGQQPTVYASGFDAITGVAFDEEGSLYVTEFSTNPANERHVRGDVVKVTEDGTRTRLGVGKLFLPSGAAVGRDGALYVSNWSVLPSTPPKGSPFGPRRGQVVRLTP